MQTCRKFMAFSVIFLCLTLVPISAVNSAEPVATHFGTKKVAAIVTVYRYNAHADVIVSRLLEGYLLDGKSEKPALQLVSLYVDQKPKGDMSADMSAKHSFSVFDTVEGALTLGTGKLAVDGVILVAEHGTYLFSKTEQRLYPKRRLITEIVKVFEKSNRVVPVFSDKHLSDNWADAKWIYDTSQRMGFPMMAGSSLPSFRRKPPANVRRNSKLKEMVGISYGGTEAYGFHAIEMIQCLAERRLGGETGIQSVQSLSGDAAWEAIRKGTISKELIDMALERGDSNRRLREGETLETAVKNPIVFVCEYNDGFRASVVKLSGVSRQFSAAWRYEDGGEVDSTLFNLEETRPFSHFSWLLKGIDRMMHTGKPTWPVERTLLTTGILNAAMISLKHDGQKINTPYLNVKYNSPWNWQQPRFVSKETE